MRVSAQQGQSGDGGAGAAGSVWQAGQASASATGRAVAKQQPQNGAAIRQAAMRLVKRRNITTF